MEITEVRVKLTGNSADRLQAFCSITFDDCFVIRDLKVIEGANGPFVAMPSRKLTFHCEKCNFKNHLRSSYCNKCGAQLKQVDVDRDQEGRVKLYADIAHPINSVCRELIQSCVIKAYQQEVDQSDQPGYVSRYDEDYAPETHEELLDAETASDEKPEAVVQDTGSEHNFVQPAEPEPRPPHTLESTRTPDKTTEVPLETAEENDFGADIF